MPKEKNDTDTALKNESKIHSLYVKPSTWERLGIVKRYLGLSYTETLDLLIGHILQEELLPKEATTELKASGLLRGEDSIGLEIQGIYGRWPESSRNLDQLKDTITELNIKLEILTDSIDDHAEAMILKETL